MAGRRRYQPLRRLGNIADQKTHMLVEVPIAIGPGIMTEREPFLTGPGAGGGDVHLRAAAHIITGPLEWHIHDQNLA